MSHTSVRSPRWIRPLPERLINKIAAGEVVERPAAVIKELVENALDAGANRIEIEVEKAGIGLIRIIDNGCGIPEEQLQIAFSRHATSKISSMAELEQIQSFGFRGEALPSIASVSRLRMVSKPAEQESAWEIIFEGGVLQEKRPTAGSNGSVVEVRDLFFNTPARRKFLRTEATESRQISRLVTALALSRIDVSFSYKVNSRVIFTLRPATTLAERAAELLAQEKLISGSKQIESMQVAFAIGPAESGQRDRQHQFLFINGRWIQSPTLSHAFVHAYGEQMARGQFPIGVIQLTIPAPLVDVNVHPAKTEVRLADEAAVRELVYSALKETIHRSASIPALSHRNTGPMNELTTNGQMQTGNGAFIPGIGSSRMTPSETGVLFGQGEPLVDRSTGEILEPRPISENRISFLESPSSVSDTTLSAASLRFLGQFDLCYLLFQHGHELLLVDQHTAHERVLFEETLDRMEASGLTSQRLLFPVQVELSPERAALFHSAEATLESSGFSLTPFGGRTVLVNAVPAILSRKSPELVLVQVLDDLDSLRKLGYDLLKSVAQSVACRAAIMRGDAVAEREAKSLVESLLSCKQPYSCPHGRPTFVRIDSFELDRRFGRR